MPGQDAIAVRVSPAAVEPVSSLYSTSATLRADKTATVTARTRGVVENLLVEEGDRVASGQVLVQLEDDEQIIAAERAATARDTTAREFERARTLHEQDLLSEEAFETARRDADDAAQAAALAELTLARTQVRAPFGGIVLKRHLDVGATVSDGTALYDLADLDPLYADVNVPERHVLQLAPRQTVRLTADSTGQTVQAVIERIAPSVDPATGTVKVTLAVARAAGLRPGAFVRVDIVIDTHEQALVVPRSALVAEGRRWNLFRLAEEGETVQSLEVRLGYEEGNRVEILEVLEGEPPLAPGDRVVSLGASALSDGARVEVHEEGETDRVSS
jgi:membrane fusion protein (multidrug efflux system)